MEWFFGFLTGTVISVFTFIICVTIFPSPKPIDVYRGKTTLQITYKDSIPIDSVVVFKNK